MLKKISLVILIISLIFLVWVYFYKIYLLNIAGNSKENYYPYLRILISIFFSLLFILALRKKYNIYYFLNLLWMVPIFIFILKIGFGSYNLEKLDYLIGRRVNNFEIRQYENRGWLINEITIKNKNEIDTLYVSENPSWENKSYQLKDKAQSKIVKSWLTGYYYVSVKD